MGVGKGILEGGARLPEDVNAAGRGHFQHAVAGLQPAHGVALQRRVRRAHHHGGALLQAGERRGLPRHIARKIRGLFDLRQRGDRQTQNPDDLLRPAHADVIKHQRALCLNVGGGDRAGELIAHIVVNKHHPVDFPEHLRLMRLDPQQLRQRPGDAGHGEGGVLDEIQIVRLEEFHFLLRPLILPHDGVPEHMPLRIQQNRIVGGGVHRKADDILRVKATLFLRNPQGADHGRKPALRLLLHPAHMGMVGGVFRISIRHKGAVGVNDRDLASAGAQIHAQQIFWHSASPSFF